MKTLIMISNLNQINLNVDGVIIGLKSLSVNMPAYFNIDDLKNIKKEIFVMINKNMHNSDLDYLKDILIKLNDYNIKGVIFYDLAVLNIGRSLNLNYDLVWGSEHATVNYNTINTYSKWCNYAYVSNDITLKDMIEIKKNTNIKLMVTLFGYLPIFVSKRHLVKNYLNTFNINDLSKINYMWDKENTYPLIDSDYTLVYTNFILNGLKEKLKLDYDYIVLNSFMIEDTLFSKVVDIFNNVNIKNQDELDDVLNSMFNNLGKGFFYKDTIYKVK